MIQGEGTKKKIKKKNKEKKEILQSPVQMLRNVYHKPNPDGLSDEQALFNLLSVPLGVSSSC